MNVCQWRWAFWTTVNKHNNGKHRKSWRGYPCRSQTNYPQFCAIVGLSYGTIQRILVDNLNMRRISVRFVPRLLSDNQKALHISVCTELKQATDDPNFISIIITSNETWVYDYDPETKQQSLQWKSPNSLQQKKRVKFAVLSAVFNLHFQVLSGVNGLWCSGGRYHSWPGMLVSGISHKLIIEYFKCITCV
jgi:hypothetical protein